MSLFEQDDTAPFRVRATISGPTNKSVTDNFMLDTGATLPLITQQLADQLDLPHVGATKVQTATGVAKMALVSGRVTVNGRSMDTTFLVASTNVLGLDVIRNLGLLTPV